MNEKILDFMIKIVKEASMLVNDNFSVSQKGNYDDLVTNLDTEIERFLINKIKESYSEFDIVSEEYNSNNNVTDNCFVIDPIDGTINFSNKLPLWGIQIACIVNKEVVAAVIHLPKMNELYYASENGAYLNDNKININIVSIKNTLYSIDGTNNLPIMQKVRKYSSGRRNFGAACVSLAFVSCGRIHAALYRSDKPWDYVPGMYICKMAGATVLDEPGFHCAAMNEELLNILKESNKEESTL